ncbi:MAG: glycosyltransferase [Fischerella sp.]|jgi:glycosyltransferase involved in cell wall biosynthesis|uniref:glycosyltransferase family 2 protein n=1 Tax=Fischerella sp. TaxID=1191 RepID=UPI0017C7BDE7|nr:glycosyltransferase family 2 protein [Fischerella sp.]NWF57766.1 glycosyltransferase [Fischerella sp.]
MISIITPVYNGDRFIEACIKNVIEQNCSEIEHIIVDGDSKDRTVEIIKLYAYKYPHIRWISEKDKGQSDAMNKGIAMAKGEILGILNVDDFYEPNVLNRVLEIFKDLPEPSLLVGNCNIWGNNGHINNVNKPSRLKLEDLLLGSDINPFPANPSAYFYHTSLHQIIGMYKVDEDYAMDLDFILRSVKHATVKYVDEVWGNFRLIEGTKTFNNVKTGRNIKSKKLIFDLYRKELSLSKRTVLVSKIYFFRTLMKIKKKVKYLKNKYKLYSKI